jgi:hypothetical protein
MLRRRCRAVIITLLPVATGAAAQNYAITGPSLGPENGAYLQPAPVVPPGGCVWENVVFSDGAIIERRPQPRVVFRCVQGSWQSFDSFDAARAPARERAPAGAGPPRRLGSTSR